MSERHPYGIDSVMHSMLGTACLLREEGSYTRAARVNVAHDFMTAMIAYISKQTDDEAITLLRNLQDHPEKFHEKR